jgi:hypothetical protein
MEQGIADQGIVLAVNGFTHEGKALLSAGVGKIIASGAEFGKKVAVQAVGNIESETVDMKQVYPFFHGAEQVVPDIRVFQIKFDKVIVPFPAFIVKSVGEG